MFENEKNPKQNDKANSFEMDFTRMKPFPGHLFKMYTGQQLEEMIESIKQFGILVPIILWHDENNAYIILSGHNRVNAAMMAGFKKAPVVVKENLSHEEAVLIVTETNLRQRSFSDMAYSERAFCLAQHYEAMKSQGKRNDLINEIELLLNPHGNTNEDTSVQVERKLENREKIGCNYGLSATNVTRYIRISTLETPLLELVDAGEIAFLAAYDISFIENEGLQTLIADVIKRDGCKVDMKMASLLREYYESGKLTNKAVEEILSGEKTRKPKSDKPKEYKIKPAVVKKYFTKGQPQNEVNDIIEKALDCVYTNSDIKYR